MEVEIRLEPGRKEPRAVIYAGADTPELQELVQRLSGVFLGPVPAFQGERAVLLVERSGVSLIPQMNAEIIRLEKAGREIVGMVLAE